MGFIDNEMAKRIGEWIEKNPERANGYFKEAREVINLSTKKYPLTSMKNKSSSLKKNTDMEKNGREMWKL